MACMRETDRSQYGNASHATHPILLFLFIPNPTHDLQQELLIYTVDVVLVQKKKKVDVYSIAEPVQARAVSPARCPVRAKIPRRCCVTPYFGR